MRNILFQYFLCGSLGVLFQIFALKVPKLKTISEKANHPFKFKDYLKDDWPAIIASFVTVGIFIFCIDEILGLKPELEKFVKWLFVFVGFTGSSIAQALFSVTNRKIMAIIDVKTNIADRIEPPINDQNIEGAKEIIKDETKK